MPGLPRDRRPAGKRRSGTRPRLGVVIAYLPEGLRPREARTLSADPAEANTPGPWPACCDPYRLPLPLLGLAELPPSPA